MKYAYCVVYLSHEYLRLWSLGRNRTPVLSMARELH